jgi:hypothetical protein
MPAYMRRYLARLFIFMGSYMAILVGGLMFARGGGHSQATLIALAILTAAPIIGIFWAIFRLLAECDDEYQRLLMVNQTLLATAITLAISTVWQFLNVYDVLASGPQWIGVIWFAMLGLAAPIVRWRA